MTALDLKSPEFLAMARSPLPPLSRLLLSATLAVVQWDLRRRTRADLRALPDFMLQDIGLDPFSAQKEAEKPFWRA